MFLPVLENDYEDLSVGKTGVARIEQGTKTEWMIRNLCFSKFLFWFREEKTSLQCGWKGGGRSRSSSS